MSFSLFWIISRAISRPPLSQTSVKNLPPTMPLGRGRRSRTADEVEQAAQQDDLVQQQAMPQDDDDQQQDDDEAQQTASGSGPSGSRSIYLRGPASLPQRPILRDRRPLIRPDGERHVTLCSSFLFILCVQNHNIN
jgi:hypothetical protein